MTKGNHLRVRTGVRAPARADDRPVVRGFGDVPWSRWSNGMNTPERVATFTPTYTHGQCAYLDGLIATFTPTSTPAGAWVAPQDPLVASPRCVITPPCNHCWYCRRHKGES